MPNDVRLRLDQLDQLDELARLNGEVDQLEWWIRGIPGPMRYMGLAAARLAVEEPRPSLAPRPTT
jgi:hypothetical protein